MKEKNLELLIQGALDASGNGRIMIEQQGHGEGAARYSVIGPEDIGRGLIAQNIEGALRNYLETCETYLQKKIRSLQRQSLNTEEEIQRTVSLCKGIEVITHP